MNRRLGISSSATCLWILALALIGWAPPASADAQHLVVSNYPTVVAVSAHTESGWTIAWAAEDAQGIPTLFLQRFDDAGAPSAPRVQVDAGIQGYGELQIVTDAAGNDLVVWLAYLDTPEAIDLYKAAAYSSSGSRLWGPEGIAPPSSSERGSTKYLSAAAAPGNGWVVGWLDLPQGISPRGVAYSRRLDPVAGAGETFAISSPTAPRWITSFALANSSTRLLAGWTEALHLTPLGFETFELHGRLVDGQGRPIAPERSLGATGFGQLGTSSLVGAGFGDDRYLFAWKSQQGSSAPQTIAALALSGDLPVGSTWILRSTPESSWSPLQLAVDRLGRALIAWQEPLFGSLQSYYYRFAVTGATLAEPEEIRYYPGGTSGASPTVATTPAGHWLVAWSRGPAGEDPAGIDGLLGAFADGCQTTNHALCLAGNRFRATASYHDHLGREGAGYTAPLTSESGTFWFFTPESVELILKVVDACSHPDFGNFWVFASGLTDVQVHLEVVDTWTGEIWERDTALGEPFPPALDTGAFDTCAATPALVHP